jgi:transcriptional regulator with XRE-family HTH domain
VPVLPLRRRVGRRVADLRIAAGITQDELAGQLGVSLRYVQRVEAGRENLSLSSLSTLAKALAVDAAAFFQRPVNTEARVGRPRASRTTK